MFVATDKAVGARVTSLDPVWQSRHEELRAYAASGRLVCPGCEQLLRFRSGEQRRPHFAHRVLSECPLSKQSAEVLEAKALLYEWLAGKYPGKVELDVDLKIPGWDRFADLVVRPDEAKPFAYWVFDRLPRNRKVLLYGIPEHVLGHVMFTESARKMGVDDSLLLSAGQRDFIGRAKYDESRAAGHMHFVDTEARKLRLYRGLHCVHAPNVYEWSVLHEFPLHEYRVCAYSGEVIAEGDREREETPTTCPAVREPTVAELARELIDQQKIRTGDSGPIVEASDRYRYRFSTSLRDDFRGNNDAAPTMQAQKCEVCGKETTEWVPSAMAKGTCVCRACHAQYLSARWRMNNHVQ